MVDAIENKNNPQQHHHPGLITSEPLPLPHLITLQILTREGYWHPESDCDSIISYLGGYVKSVSQSTQSPRMQDSGVSILF